MPIASPEGVPVMLRVRGLRHDYAGRTVLSVASWDVPRAASSLVVGPSGSGKSTLLAAIAGLLRPSAGELVVDGRDLSGLGPAERDRFRARHVGLVLQTLHLIGAISVRDNLRLAQRLAHFAPDDRRIDAILEALGVGGLGARRARELSTGEAQRVAIARAVINRPALVLADEPTSALDDVQCEASIRLLIDTAAQSGATLVVATHDQRIRAHFRETLAL